MEQGMGTYEGATGSASEDVCRALCYPSAAAVVEAEAAKVERQSSTQPKEPALWQSPSARLTVQLELKPVTIVPGTPGASGQFEQVAAFEFRPSKPWSLVNPGNGDSKNHHGASRLPGYPRSLIS
ncbi:hypothetical protein E2320_016696 [Naja naja]|nr:hypothetical protein E2320_016696 [Naja naja]